MIRKTTASNTHFPAHESLQEYAIRHDLSVEKAYPAWRNRPYQETPVSLLSDDAKRQYAAAGTIIKDETGAYIWPAYGPGLGVR